jgi:hypothetical protein
MAIVRANSSATENSAKWCHQRSHVALLRWVPPRAMIGGGLSMPEGSGSLNKPTDIIGYMVRISYIIRCIAVDYIQLNTIFIRELFSIPDVLFSHI